MLDINIDIDEDKVASFRGINCSYVRYKRFYNHCRLWNNYVLIVAMLDINMDICTMFEMKYIGINCDYVRYKQPI